MLKKIVYILIVQLLATTSFAEVSNNSRFSRHFYIGGLGGYGSTTWEGLVPSLEKQNSAIGISTPIRVEEGGGVYGFLAGYEFSPYFAIEGSYFKYPDAKVHFEDISLFSFNNDGKTHFSTRTNAYSLMGKIMLVIPKTYLRAFSSFGVADVHRKDLLNDHWRLSPTFGAGINYHITDRIMAELAGNYIAGYGESELNPTEVYFPFLYSVTFRLAYYF